MPNATTRLVLALVLAVAIAAACVPAGVRDRLAGPAAQAVERAAYESYHRMELGRLRLGAYTTNALIDVDLPRGARLTVEAFDDHDYRLRVDSDFVEGIVWLVSPRGVRRVFLR